MGKGGCLGRGGGGLSEEWELCRQGKVKKTGRNRGKGG
jgi:hypothetical protein